MKRNGAIPAATSAAGLAGALGISERRVSTVKAEGRLPLSQDGQIDLRALLRIGWQSCLAGGAQRAPDGLPRESVGRFLEVSALTLESALREVAAGVVMAAAEVGTSRQEAEALADLAALLVASAVQAEADHAGLRDLRLPHPEAWRATVNWPALFGAGGESIVVGRMRADSAAELAGA
jgi:hypothetical protein